MSEENKKSPVTIRSIEIEDIVIAEKEGHPVTGIEIKYAKRTRTADGGWDVEPVDVRTPEIALEKIREALIFCFMAIGAQDQVSKDDLVEAVRTFADTLPLEMQERLDDMEGDFCNGEIEDVKCQICTTPDCPAKQGDILDGLDEATLKQMALSGGMHSNNDKN